MLHLARLWEGDVVLDCSSRHYSLSSCWDGSSSAALLARVPVIIPLPVPEKAIQAEMTLYQEKRDIGVTAAVVAVITVSAAAATVAGLAMAQTSLVVDTVDRLAGQVREVLQMQNALNSRIKFGLLNLNQQTALLQEQVDSWVIQQMSCSHFYRTACVTPSVVTNASEIVKFYFP